MVYCVTYDDGEEECFRNGFWFTKTGEIIKWSVLAGIFLIFTAWFVGGYMHAKRRMRKGQPLLAYHRFLVPYRDRRRYGQTPQNHFTFYSAQPYGVRPDGTYPAPPPQYNYDSPPAYMPPPGATKAHPHQGGVEMQPQYGVPPQPTGEAQPFPPYPGPTQESGVVRPGGDVENQNQDLPERPQRARLGGFMDRFRK